LQNLQNLVVFLLLIWHQLFTSFIVAHTSVVLYLWWILRHRLVRLLYGIELGLILILRKWVSMLSPRGRLLATSDLCVRVLLKRWLRHLLFKFDLLRHTTPTASNLCLFWHLNRINLHSLSNILMLGHTTPTTCRHVWSLHHISGIRRSF